MSLILRSFGRVGAAMPSRLMLVAALGAAIGAVILPQYADGQAVEGAEATAGGPGLPNGRVYEQVSPQLKPGTEAGELLGTTPPYIVAGLAGNEVAYSTTGPVGEAPTGLENFTVSRRHSTGWTSRGPIPRGVGQQRIFWSNPQDGLQFSAGLTEALFIAPDAFGAEQEIASETAHIYRYGEDGTLQWIGKPTISDPVKFQGFEGAQIGEIAGASLDMSTVYFAFEGTLTAADDEPNPALGDVSRKTAISSMNESGHPPQSDDSFYEWHDGVLSSAGILPNGHLDPYGAVPAATLTQESPAQRNQISEDGRTAFFLSPDPRAQAGRPSELYARETAASGAQTTVLVSRDMVLPETAEGPAASPTSVGGGDNFYATPDGTLAFFGSEAQLTPNAPAAAEPKEYEFDTHTNTLSYLPGVAPANILASAANGANFMFVREGQLEMWSAGNVTDIDSVPPTPIVHADASGTAYAIQTSSSFADYQFNNGGGAYTQVYRYELASNSLTCVSCPQRPATVDGDAELTHDNGDTGAGNTINGITPENRGISEDGARVFFDTPAALTPQDTNGVRDVYEWEGGNIYLISSGASKGPSLFGDNSPSGNDVFFSTIEGLVAGDADEGYDVYDARVPRAGDRPPPSAVPCEGAVCQGPPSVPNLINAPASESFSGPGNLTPESPSTQLGGKGKRVKATPTKRQKRLRAALNGCKQRFGQNRHVRRRCERSARRRHGAKAANAGRSHSHHNGRGN